MFVGFKKGAFSIYFGDAPIYHFDLEGRWQRAYIEPTHYLKSLDTTVQAIDRVREGANLVLRRRTLGEDEAAGLDLQVRGIALGLMGELDSARDPPPGAARGQGSSPGERSASRVPGEDRRLGRVGVAGTPRAVQIHLRAAALSAAAMPERRRPPGDNRQRWRQELRPGSGVGLLGPIAGRVRGACPRGRLPIGPSAIPDASRLPGRLRCPSPSGPGSDGLPRDPGPDISIRSRLESEFGIVRRRFATSRRHPRLPRRFFFTPSRSGVAHGLPGSPSRPRQPGRRVGRSLGSPGLWKDMEGRRAR